MSRVAHICNLPLPPDHPDFGKLSTHPGRWVLNLALAQKAHAGMEPELVVHLPGAGETYSTEVEGIPVHYLAAPDRFRAATFFQLDARRISKFVRRLTPDLVHAHGTEDCHLLAAQATGFPFLVTLQGCYFLINRVLPPKLVSRAQVVEFTEMMALRRTDHAIAKSQYVGEELRRRFPHLSLHLVPNTFDPRLLDLPCHEAREPGSMAFVGTVVERKGVHLLAEALALLRPEDQKRITLHIFGDRPNRASPYELEVISRLRHLLGDRLVTHGTIPGIEVAHSLSQIELLVAPSLEEMFGNQLIEALLVGCRAIVTDETAMAENLQRFGGGEVVPQQNSALLADAIVRNLHSSGSNAERDQVRKNICGFMGPSIVASQHAKIYQKVLNQ